MSIRIQTDHLSGTQASETSRANEVSKLAQSSSAKTRGAGGDGDNVEISSLSEGISSANAAQQAHETGRVRHLAALYASGRYQVDSQAVSHAMVSHALGQSGGGEVK